MDFLRDCVKLHDDDNNEYDLNNWKRVSELRSEVGHEEKDRVSLLMQARNAIERSDYPELSKLELEIEEKLEELADVYDRYRRNIF